MALKGVDPVLVSLGPTLAMRASLVAAFASTRTSLALKIARTACSSAAHGIKAVASLENLARPLGKDHGIDDMT